MPTDNVVAIYPTSAALNLQGNWTDFALQNPQGDDQIVVFASSRASGAVEFTGTQVAVYGVVPAGESVESFYAVDGSFQDTYVSPGNASTPQWGTAFYISPLLSAGTHELTFNVTNATVKSIFALEFILYEGAGGQDASMTQTSLPTGAAAAATGYATVAVSGLSSVNVGAIAGGVVGGVAGLIVIGLLIFFGLRRRNRRPYYYAESGDLLREEVKAMPFTKGAPLVPDDDSDVSFKVKPQVFSYAASSEGTQDHQPVRRSEVGDSTYSSPSTGTYSSRPTLAVVGGPPGIRHAPNMARSKAAEAGLLSVEKQPTYHADSGVRFDSNGKPVAPGSNSGSAASSHEPLARTPTGISPSYSED